MNTPHRSWPVRRRFKRFEARDMPATMVADTFARVIDVSVRGLAVETQSQLKMGKSYAFDLSHGGDVLVVNGTIRWSKLRGARKTDTGGVEKVFRAGVVLDELDLDDERRLTNFIERYGDVTPGERLFARVCHASPEPANDGSSFGVRVKNLSRTKIVMESELGIDLGARCEISLRLHGQGFKARAQVVSLEERRVAKPEARHLIALQLSEVSEAHRQVLEAYINRELGRMQPLGRAASRTTPAEDRAAARPREPSGSADVEDVDSRPLKGHAKSRVVHRHGCRSYGSRDCTAEFVNLAEAAAAGFRPCRLCHRD